MSEKENSNQPEKSTPTEISKVKDIIEKGQKNHINLNKDGIGNSKHKHESYIPGFEHVVPLPPKPKNDVKGSADESK